MRNVHLRLRAMVKKKTKLHKYSVPSIPKIPPQFFFSTFVIIQENGLLIQYIYDQVAVCASTVHVHLLRVQKHISYYPCFKLT